MIGILSTVPILTEVCTFFSKNREKELTVLKEELFSRSALITYIDEFVPKV